MSNSFALSKIKELLDALLKTLKPKPESPNRQGVTPKAHPPKLYDRAEETAKKFQLAYLSDLSEFPYVKEKITPLPYAFAKAHLLLPLEEKGGVLTVAMTHPFDFETLEEARCLTRRDIHLALAPKAALEEAIELCYHQKENEASEYIASLQHEDAAPVQNEEEGYDLLEKNTESPVIRMLNVMLAEAIQQGASDVHFEPMENGL